MKKVGLEQCWKNYCVTIADEKGGNEGTTELFIIDVVPLDIRGLRRTPLD